LSATAPSDRPETFDAESGPRGMAAAAAAFLPPPADRAPLARKRLKIWQIPSSWLCSIVGTCLAPADVDRIVRRAGIRFPDGTEAFDIHGFMVTRAAEQGRVGREINKAVDDKYAALVRKVGAETDQGRLGALWDELCGRGLVAGAYWAVMSHANVGEELKLHAFGEVHMLSHFMGGCNRHNAKELWLAQRRLERLADTLARARRQSQDTVTARERRIGELEQELSQARHERARAQAGRAPGGLGRGPQARGTDTAPCGTADASPRRAPGSRRSRPRIRDCGRCSGCWSRPRRPGHRWRRNHARSPRAPGRSRRSRAAASSTSAVAVSCCRICVCAPRPATPACCTTTAARRRACNRWGAWSTAPMRSSARSTA
jgi:hypothetical protein